MMQSQFQIYLIVAAVSVATATFAQTEILSEVQNIEVLIQDPSEEDGETENRQFDTPLAPKPVVPTVRNIQDGLITILGQSRERLPDTPRGSSKIKTETLLQALETDPQIEDSKIIIIVPFGRHSGLEAFIVESTTLDESDDPILENEVIEAQAP